MNNIKESYDIVYCFHQDKTSLNGFAVMQINNVDSYFLVQTITRIQQNGGFSINVKSSGVPEFRVPLTLVD